MKIRRRAIFFILVFVGAGAVHTDEFAPEIPLINAKEKQQLLNQEVIVREIQNPDLPGKTYQAMALFNTSVESVYHAITDFQRYPDFMPNIAKIETVSAEKNAATLNYYLTLPLGKTKKYRLKTYFSYAPEQASLRWIQISWLELKEQETIKDTTGYWFIVPYADKPEQVLVLYRVYTDPGEITFGLGWIVDILTKHSIPNVLKNTRHFILTKK